MTRAARSRQLVSLGQSRGVRAALPTCAALGLAMAVIIGCSERRYPISGKVVYADGSPYEAGGIVAIESLSREKPVMTRALIQPDGTFVTSPGRAGGALAGSYRVRLVPPPSDDGADRRHDGAGFAKKFLRFETSDLEWSIGPGRNGPPFVIDLGPRPGR